MSKTYKTLTPDDVKALEACAAKYGSIKREEDLDDLTVGPSSCSLCALYWKRPNADSVARGYLVDCNGCPVAHFTGHYGCLGSPFKPRRDSMSIGDVLAEYHALGYEYKALRKFLRMCEKEYLFLKDLLDNSPRQ